jgi:hypothetical protein
MVGNDSRARPDDVDRRAQSCGLSGVEPFNDGFAETQARAVRCHHPNLNFEARTSLTLVLDDRLIQHRVLARVTTLGCHDRGSWPAVVVNNRHNRSNDCENATESDSQAAEGLRQDRWPNGGRPLAQHRE